MSSMLPPAIGMLWAMSLPPMCSAPKMLKRLGRRPARSSNGPVSSWRERHPLASHAIGQPSESVSASSITVWVAGSAQEALHGRARFGAWLRAGDQSIATWLSWPRLMAQQFAAVSDLHEPRILILCRSACDQNLLVLFLEV